MDVGVDPCDGSRPQAHRGAVQRLSPIILDWAAMQTDHRDPAGDTALRTAFLARCSACLGSTSSDLGDSCASSPVPELATTTVIMPSCAAQCSAIVRAYNLSTPRSQVNPSDIVGVCTSGSSFSMHLWESEQADSSWRTRIALISLGCLCSVASQAQPAR